MVAQMAEFYCCPCSLHGSVVCIREALYKVVKFEAVEFEAVEFVVCGDEFPNSIILEPTPGKLIEENLAI